jgi:hypothetical protein
MAFRKRQRSQIADEALALHDVDKKPEDSKGSSSKSVQARIRPKMFSRGMLN